MHINAAPITMLLLATCVAVNEFFLALTIANDYILKDSDVIKL